MKDQSKDDGIVIGRCDRPAGGWGALKGVAQALGRGDPGKELAALARLNHASGIDCPGCAWPDAPDGGRVQFCEQGAKAVCHEAATQRVDAGFFARHPLSELRGHDDLWLEAQGRLSEPLRYDAMSDCYTPISWDDAFALAGERLRALRQQHGADASAFYTSGRSSNEAAFLYQLLARAYGTNNLPDSSNLCHEPSGIALRDAIGVAKGTATLADFASADAIFIFGHNPASNHPRMMGELHRAHRRGCRIVVFNPLREAGLVRFTDPQNLGEMLGGTAEPIADNYYPVRIGGDLAALKGVIRALFEAEQAALAHGLPAVLDHVFIASHTEGFAALYDDIMQVPWAHIEAESGLTRAQLTEAAQIYAQADAVLATWCMGLTQHEHAVATIQMLVNLLLLRGNIGKPGAGAVPVRGHSNVQGDRTVSITARPTAAWLDALEREFGIIAPRTEGRDALATLHGLVDGELHALVSLGGNFGLACPDSPRLLAALSRCDFTAHIATKLNRTHLYPGREGLLLPCLGRTEADVQASGRQFVSVEDSMSMVHASHGANPPASPLLRSEPAIVAGLAHHVVGSSPIDWGHLAADYDRIRAAIERTAARVVDGFTDYNATVRNPRGFHLPNAAGQRCWATASGRACFRVHALPADTPVQRARAQHGDAVLCLMTVRSHDQYNTTVYGLNDRYRGVFGGRRVLFMNPADIARLGLADGAWITLRSLASDGLIRRVTGLRIVAYEIPVGCVAGYFPELTPLAAPEWRAQGANTPAVKAIPVVVEGYGPSVA